MTNIDSEASSARSEFSARDMAALAIGVICNLLAASTCREYFSILLSVGVMGSRVDGRGGLWETSSLLPFLVVAVVASRWLVAQSPVAKRTTDYLALTSVIWWLLSIAIKYLIRTSLH